MLAVGMAVNDAQGQAVVGISVASITARMPRERQQFIVKWMRQALGEHLPKGL